ncbi:BRO family protein [Pokkaliibacter plantistimulans]|nr:BRO family protein [Pokkaliibacter plantistimulans]
MDYSEYEGERCKDVDLFHFEEDFMNFNDLARANGFTYWYARDFMFMLGYSSYETFRKVLNKAMTTCLTLDIDTSDNFQQTHRTLDGKEVKDFKLSRFACYLVAMNGDNKKEKVAQAQAFFAVTAEAIQRYVDNPEEVERVLIREEITAHEKTLASTAKAAGIETAQDYAFFQNAGYRGMYNMSLTQLKEYKGLAQKNRSLLDFMGKEELAANLFRITQTDLKMKNEAIQGQRLAENTAREVGSKIRKTMLDISGIAPEDMALADDIKKVKTSLKQTHRGLKKLDS